MFKISFKHLLQDDPPLTMSKSSGQLTSLRATGAMSASHSNMGVGGMGLSEPMGLCQSSNLGSGVLTTATGAGAGMVSYTSEGDVSPPFATLSRNYL